MRPGETTRDDSPRALELPVTQTGGGSTLKAVILDFDGVILESVDIKTRAFHLLFQDRPDQIERIVQLHRDNTGLSRYEKFRIIYLDYLKKPLSEKEVSRLDRAYSNLVVAEVLSCPFVPGAQEFLAHAVGRWPLFVVSGTPHDELREIVQLRGLGRYFHRVYGSPRSKETLLREILAENGWCSKNLVFVGDGLADLHAADAAGIPFVGRVCKGESNPFPASVRSIVSDLQDLLSRWPTIVADLS